MNVIVSNKQKEIIDNANIDAIKDLYGLFNVEDLINNFKYYFFSKMIIDATSIIDFSNPEVLKKLASGIGADKLIILLPSSPKPPTTFISLLMNLGIYNFTVDINDVPRLLQKSNTRDDVLNMINGGINRVNSSPSNSGSDAMFINTAITDNDDNSTPVNNVPSKKIIGFKNVTLHAGSTSLIYMIKKQLETKYKKSVVAIEVTSNDFIYFRAENMINTNNNNLESIIQNCNNDVILLDLGTSNFETLCSKVLYLVEPSVIKINKLMVEDRKSFEYLQGKMVVLNKSMLSSNDVQVFSKEAGLPIYFNIPPLNDRLLSDIIDDLLSKLEIVTGNKRNGIFNTFE